MPSGRGRVCAVCRRDEVIGLVLGQVAGIDPALSAAQVTAAVDAVATNPAIWRSLATALRAHPDALASGAPPVVGRLVIELIARGAHGLRAPTCVVCGRVGWALTVTDGGGMCKRCAARRNPETCARCGVVKPVAGRIGQGEPICEPCRRHTRGHRPCGVCGKTASIAVRARAGEPEICVNCYQLPVAACHVCGRLRPCSFAGTERAICPRCAPRATAVCARCGQDRPPSAHWDEGPVCEPCYTAALRHRGHCKVCGHERRLVAPPGPEATTCADCAGLPVTHACGDCGREDKLFERNRCARCSLHRRTTALLCDNTGEVPAELTGVLEAIRAARTPPAALNWLRTGAGAEILADLAAGRIPATHHALDRHPRRPAADYLRQILTANGALPPRDEGLARAERWLTELLATITDEQQRRLLRTFATWKVMRRLREHHRAATRAATRPMTGPDARTYTAHARLKIRTAARFLTWLHDRNTTLAECGQADIDQWLSTGPAACRVRDFLTWAADHGHCHPFTIPSPPRYTGTTLDPDQRWALLHQLLHDDELELVDRVAGALLLLFGQQQSRIAAMTTDQITQQGTEVFLRLGYHDLPVPEPLGALLLQLAADGKTHIGIGTPPHAQTRWLFPGGIPGRPITASRLADRLRKLGIPTQAGRRAALTDLAAQLPAAVLADLLGLHPTTAVNWTHQAGSNWTRYAAELAHTSEHEP